MTKVYEVGLVNSVFRNREKMSAEQLESTLDEMLEHCNVLAEWIHEHEGDITEMKHLAQGNAYLLEQYEAENRDSVVALAQKRMRALGIEY